VFGDREQARIECDPRASDDSGIFSVLRMGANRTGELNDGNQR
jgi:hypothetical protein